MSYSTDRVNYSVLAKTARANNCWVYRISTKEWFTPDEIQAMENDSNGKSKGEVSVRASDFVIKSPYAAIKYYNGHLRALTEKISAIEKKLEESYTVEFKPKR